MISKQEREKWYMRELKMEVTIKIDDLKGALDQEIYSPKKERD